MRHIVHTFTLFSSASPSPCAPIQELGFNVIEINPGMDRSGATVLRLVGEATQSRRLMHRAAAAVQQGQVQGQGKKGGAEGAGLAGAGTKTGRGGGRGGRGGKRKALGEWCGASKGCCVHSLTDHTAKEWMCGAQL